MAGIKGTAIESLVADVNRIVQEGRVPPDELEAQLQREDLEILGQKILAALWYPLGTYDRLTQLMLRAEGGGEMRYVIERGRRAAARLRDSGIYGQLARDRKQLGTRIGRMMVTLGPAMYQDTQWTFHDESSDNASHFRIEARVPSEFPMWLVMPRRVSSNTYRMSTADIQSAYRASAALSRCLSSVAESSGPSQPQK